jgi:hypothetical protein
MTGQGSTMKHSRGFSWIALGLLVALTTGCAQIKLGAPIASMDNIQKARGASMAPAALGHIALAAGKDKSLDSSLSVRSNSLASPYDDSFAQYLKQTLAAELQGAGLLDGTSPLLIEGVLVDNQLDAPIGTGRARIAARFSVVRAGKRVYDRELVASSTWDSPFVGAVAIPAAVNEYTALHRKLVAQLLDDPGFRAAVRQ